MDTMVKECHSCKSETDCIINPDGKWTCEECLIKTKHKGYPQKTIGDLLQEIDDLKSQKAALLAACKKAHQYFSDLNRGPTILKNKHDILMEKQLQSAIEQARESGE